MDTKSTNNYFIYVAVFAAIPKYIVVLFTRIAVLKVFKICFPFSLYCLRVNLMSFATGSAYSWTSPVLPKLKSNDTEINPFPFPITTLEESWIASLLSLGACIGPFAAGQLVNRIGMKKTLLIFSVPFFASHIIYAFGTNVYLFFFARFIFGLGAGCVFSVLPNYVAEISEDSIRGTLGCIMGIMLTLGTLSSFIVGPFLNLKMLSLFNLIPICLFYISFGTFCPESPYYLISIGDKAAATEALKKLRNESSGAMEKELLYITANIEKSRNHSNKITDIFKSRGLIKGLIISNGLMVFQQFSGITAVIGYMQSIFEVSGIGIPSHISVIIIGTIQFITTTVTTQLADRLGRKILLLISSTGSFLSLLALGAYFFLQSKGSEVETLSWLPISSLVVFIVSINLGLGALVWTIMGELFPPNVKAIASSITTFTCLFLAFVITMCFPYLSLMLGMAGCFWVFAGFCFASILFAQFVVPETNGKSFAEIQIMLNK